MKALIAAVVLSAIAAGSALAQGKQTPGNPQDQERAAKAEKERARIEKEYNDTLARTRTEGPVRKSDPWGTVRPGNDAKR